ncbi:MAG: DUF3786 domain-containing protein [Ignisphaera sp.]|nr:DUF3786 domain-containing protein [Ignisphaera sp.]MCX8167631.1 DUF3786 domain-containing protein [Ignisphaera sp.]MDW8085958.1 DUF3786 domain-containing protein [Ignisphaera sp.]
MDFWERWSWERARERIRGLSGRLGFERGDELRFFNLRLDLTNGSIYDEVLERFLTDRERVGLYYILSLYSETKSEVKESGELISLSRQLCPFIHCSNLRRNIEAVERLFGTDPTLLYKAAKPLDYQPIEIGDAAIKVYALPRVPIVLVVWAGEEGIPPSSEILFDKTAFSYLGSEISDVCEAAMGIARALTARLILSLARMLNIDITGINFGGYGYTCAD